MRTRPDSNESKAIHPLERRGNPRRPTTAVFTVRLPGGTVMGGGRDISSGGAYFVTADEIEVELSFEIDGKERSVPARIVRMDPIGRGSLGIAVEFAHPLADL